MRARVLVASALLATGCLASEGSPTAGAGGPDAGVEVPPGTGPNGEITYCDVAKAVFVPKCAACHKPGLQAPDLTAEGAKTSLVGVASAQFGGRMRVVAGDPSASLLHRKIAGAQASDEGAPMPLGSMLTAAEVATVDAWIQGGASFTCDTPIDVVPMAFHPAGFAAREVHGTALKTHQMDCRTCHGGDLKGGTAPSCDTCHMQGWRTSCTYCHGGTDDDTGAPPRDLNGTTDTMALSFRAHTQHVSESDHAPYDCTQCHVKPEDVLSVGHIFDDTRGAEVDFSGGISADGVYDGNGSCSSMYCHGNGRGANGSYAHDRAKPDCNGCHPGPRPNDTQLRTMSGEHRKHMREGLACTDCHNDTVSGAGTLVDVSLHANGEKDVVFGSATMSRNNGTCTGTCHNERHSGERWD